MLTMLLTIALSSAPPGGSPESKARPGLGLQIAGGVTIGLGAGALATALSLISPRNRRANAYALGASPGATGFPAGRYTHYRTLEGEMRRLRIAILVCVWTGLAAMVAGSALLIAGGVRKRRARRDAHARLTLGPGGVLHF